MNSEKTSSDFKSSIRFENRINAICQTLAREYERVRPEFGSDGFRSRVHARIVQQLQTAPDHLLDLDGELNSQRLDQFVKETEPLPADLAVWTIHGACAYAVVADLAYLKGDIERAWDFVTQAALHLGWILSIGQGPEIYDNEVLKFVKSKRGEKAAQGRHKDTNEMKAAAYAFVRASGVYPTQPRAISGIQEMLKEKFPTRTLRDPDGTILSWLEKMPDRMEYFESLMKQPKK